MTLELVKYPNPPLLQPSAPWDFAWERDPATGLTLAEIKERMFEVMYASHGVGLAANQIGLRLRVFVADLDAGTKKQGTHPMLAVNPELSRLDGEQYGREGCLSIHPEVQFPVKRHRSLHLLGYDIEGKVFEGDVSGWEARMVQHEVDHLDGRCCIDLTDRYSRAIAMKKWARLKGRRR